MLLLITQVLMRVTLLCHAVACRFLPKIRFVKPYSNMPNSSILQVHITEQGSFGKARLVAEQEKVESFGQVIENAWLHGTCCTFPCTTCWKHVAFKIKQRFTTRKYRNISFLRASMTSTLSSLMTAEMTTISWSFTHEAQWGIVTLMPFSNDVVIFVDLMSEPLMV